MLNWTYNGREVLSHNDLFDECTDIVYQIWYDANLCYIGKKAVRAIRKKPPLKGYKRNRRIMTNLPFVNYEGSHDTDLVPVRKEIIYQCSSRKTSTYMEALMLFEKNALGSPRYLNDNILGKFFPKDLNGLIE